MRRVGRVAQGLAISCHLGPTLAVTALALALALGVGVDAGTAAVLGAAVLAGQLSVGWSNDWIDAGRDLAVGRRDKPVVSGLVSARTLRGAALGAAAACVGLSFAVGWLAGAAHVLAVASAWSYNLGLKSTPWSWAPYALSFGLLTAFVTLALPGHPWPAWWVPVAAGLLGVGAHLANVLPDLEDDDATGVRGLPHRLGRVGASLLAPGLLVAATALVVLGPPGPAPAGSWVGLAAAAALAGAGGAIALRRHRSKAPFYLTMVVAAVAVVLLVRAASALTTTA
ncbi:UbiA family prenyltransferase [Pengzhenrongella sicca]|uniref:UbiA family prenyltransferase n=1 Tax=Pengzhenrongella sicca TaxID=2819238 RepID=A0A8A4ZBA9_9MICO|nr:UbiA family prenyltransferase [Pengzhenrongella sicca]QTE27876.1 UbiA family prenyltransferase [Pengzhenrongella sicca]